MSIRNLFLGCFLLMIAACTAANPKPLVFNGDTLPFNNEYKRTYIGDLKKSAGLVEISGIACSRVTPGYIWMESDDYSDCIIATDEQGKTRYKLVNLTPKVGRSDWEDMCGGVYNGLTTFSLVLLATIMPVSATIRLFIWRSRKSPVANL